MLPLPLREAWPVLSLSKGGEGQPRGRKPSMTTRKSPRLPFHAWRASSLFGLQRLTNKREQLRFLNWFALTLLRQAQDRPSLSQREREQIEPREAAALIKPGPSAAMARVRNSKPLLAVPRSAGRGAGAQRSMRASCSDSLPLFERRERSERSEFGSAAPRPSIAGCPQRSEGTRPVGSAFFAYFLCRDKESRSPAGANPRPAAHPTPHALSQDPT